MKKLSIIALLALASCSRGDLASTRAALTTDGGLSQGCGSVTYQGCCSGAQRVRYCVDETLVEVECSGNLSCGWAGAFGLYLCGGEQSADPSGLVSPTCPAVDGGLSGDLATALDLSLVDSTQDGGPDPVDGGDAMATPDGGGCGALTFIGCCAEDKLFFCAGDQIVVKACSAGSCGWNASGGYYSCETTGGENPSVPRSCGALLGDAGVPSIDAAPPSDLAVVGDQAVVDQGAGEADSKIGSDGFTVVGDDGGGGEEAGSIPDDLGGIDAVGLDARGGPDGGQLSVAGGGCECGIGEDLLAVGAMADYEQYGWVSVPLGWLVLWARRRRRETST